MISSDPLIFPLADDWRKEQRHMCRKLRAQFFYAREEEVEDAIEAALEVAILRQMVFDLEDQARAWLYLAASFYLRNELRKQRRFASLAEISWHSREDEAVLMFETRDLIDAALSLLSLEDRNLLIARFTNGFSIVECANSLGIRPLALKKRQQRALRGIRKIVK